MPNNKKSSLPSAKNISDKDTDQFPIVGIGASAGGLEALEQFIGNLPEHNGMAFAVIQHLDPNQKGMLPELLQRISLMKVFQAKDSMDVEVNCVYVIPPNKNMSISKGKLHLFAPLKVKGLKLPIDFFFCSLAEDQHEKSIGLILSGMGSDGTVGLASIKEQGGLVMVQDPTTAKFESMPRNAIDSVEVDIIAPASELPAKLIEFLKHIPVVKKELGIDTKDKSSLEKIILQLRTHTGNDFSHYKKNTLYRRIERRMDVHKIEKIFAYVHFLHDNPKELDILFRELMIGVTNFFRDAPVWEMIKETVIPGILTDLQPGSIIRAWVPACSTGEEAYSLAIVFKEALEKFKPHGGISLQIFATDLDLEAIDTARKGVFNVNISSNVSQDRIKRFFLKSDEGYVVNTEIREMIVFAQQNIIRHPPFTKIDILCCRNLLIYMEQELQKKIFRLFYYSINHNGILLLGNSESLGTNSHLFSPVDSKLKIFRKSESHEKPELFDFPSSFSHSKKENLENKEPEKINPNIQSLTDQLLLQHFSPAGVLVNENGDIIYISGRTGKYLEPSVGKANLNIFAMLREGLRNEFPAAFRQAITKKEAVVLRNMKVGTNGSSQTLNVNIQWIEKPEALHGKIMITFIDGPQHIDVQYPTKKEKNPAQITKYSELEQELLSTRAKMQNTLEEMQTAQEEYKSTNEELQSTNEELQSTNEELMSSKEEMQSLNEEIQTMNAELQSKVNEFSRINNDIKNLLNSTDIATLFLDKDLNIRRFTNQTTTLFKLIKSDIGRPFTDQVSRLNYPDLATDAQKVLNTLKSIQKQIPNKDGRWFSVRIMPYNTVEDKIDGLVITFINITDLKIMELKMEEKDEMLHFLLKSSEDVIIKLSTSWKILEYNLAAEKFFQKKHKEVLNKNFIQLFIPEQSQKKIEKEFNKLLAEKKEERIRIQLLTAESNVQVVTCIVNVLKNKLKKADGIIIVIKK